MGKEDQLEQAKAGQQRRKRGFTRKSMINIVLALFLSPFEWLQEMAFS